MVWTTKLDWMQSSQTFKIEANGTLTSISNTSWSGDSDAEYEITCPFADQVYIPEYKACLRVCEPGKEYDIDTNMCLCPKNTTRTSSGSCALTCDPTTSTFDTYRLKFNDEKTNTCHYAYDSNTGPLQSTFMLHKPGFAIEPAYYTELGEGGEATCLTNPDCDAIVDGGVLVSFKPDMYGKLGWSKGPESSTTFKISRA
tara:strand:+ start:339 stop:935 length:597 start_codon:yes stop_codon:yes gene_type:complete